MRRARTPRRSRRRRAPALAVALALGVGAGGCGDGEGERTIAALPSASSPALVRAAAIEGAVRRWADAATLAGARAGAEHARNLITGRTVAGAGDGDDDGRVRAVAVGLLPGADGSDGLASAVRGRCVRRDVLGGDWSRPRARWSALMARIRAWRPSNNTFPALPSHAQRVVGWASLALAARSLDEAIEYAGHAGLHATIVSDALRSPDAGGCPG